jgi:hypothetical protein
MMFLKLAAPWKFAQIEVSYLDPHGPSTSVTKSTVDGCGEKPFRGFDKFILHVVKSLQFDEPSHGGVQSSRSLRVTPRNGVPL